MVKERGPFLDFVDRITNAETTINVNIEDSGRLFKHSLSLMGRVSINLRALPLKKPLYPWEMACL